jgi:hypothetical protein
MSLRNTLTNIMGGVIALYGTGEIALGNMTPFKAIIGGATMLVSFATGAKDDQLAALIAKVSPEDKAAVHEVGALLLDAVAGRMGYDVTLQVRNNGDSDFGVGDSDWGNTRHHGTAQLGADVGTEGARFGRTNDKPYQAAVDEARRNLYPQIDGAGITGAEYVARTKAAMDRQDDEFCTLEGI